MYSQIIKSVRTKDEADIMLGEISDLSDSLYESGSKGFDSTLKAKVRSWVAEMLTTDQTESGLGREEYLENLKAELEKLPLVNLTLAFEPTNQFLDTVSAFVREASNNNALIDIEVGPSIMGGLIISYKGIYKDYSLVKVVDSAEPEIEEIIREKFKVNE